MFANNTDPAVLLYRAERARWQQKVQYSPAGRPLCQYCGVHEAQYTGKRRKTDNSKVMRKFQDKYECSQCHQMRLYKMVYRGPVSSRGSDDAPCY